MRSKALMYLALAIVPASLAATAVAASTSGVSVTGPMCGDATNGDSQIVGKPVGFIYKVANNIASPQVTNLVFQLPSRAAAAEPVMTLGKLMSGDCNSPADIAAASPFKKGAPRCKLSLNTFGNRLQRWTCSSMTVPAGKWRLVSISFHQGFGRPGRFKTYFWAEQDSGPTKPVKAVAPIVPEGALRRFEDAGSTCRRRPRTFIKLKQLTS